MKVMKRIASYYLPLILFLGLCLLLSCFVVKYSNNFPQILNVAFGAVIGSSVGFFLSYYTRKNFDRDNRITYLRLALRGVEIVVTQLITIKSQHVLPKIEVMKDFSDELDWGKLKTWLAQDGKEKVLSEIADPDIKIYLDRNECFKVLDHDLGNFREKLDEMMLCYIWLEVNLSSLNAVKDINRNLCLETKNRYLNSIANDTNEAAGDVVKRSILQGLLDIKDTNKALLSFVNLSLVFAELFCLILKQYLSEVSPGDKKRFRKPPITNKFKYYLTTDEEKRKILSGQLSWLYEKYYT